MSEPIVVVAVATPLDGRIDEVEAVLRAEIPAVHAEHGCERYALHRTVEGDRLVMIERWTDTQSLAAHREAEPMGRIVAGLAGLLAGPLDVTRMSPAPFGLPEKGQL